ncbi:unnamed protein product [Nezara viridula]|uniref:Uncharacterized protein n=1 Tax=Nezara viridula TaxID=85310 RepID=A0A9P0HCT6_NEZVI|nr:unnamed protein product [Nezara viridula]
MKKSIQNRLTLERQNGETLSYARFRLFSASSLNRPKIEAMAKPEVLRSLETYVPYDIRDFHNLRQIGSRTVSDRSRTAFAGCILPLTVSGDSYTRLARTLQKRMTQEEDGIAQDDTCLLDDNYIICVCTHWRLDEIGLEICPCGPCTSTHSRTLVNGGGGRYYRERRWGVGGGTGQWGPFMRGEPRQRWGRNPPHAPPPLAYYRVTPLGLISSKISTAAFR